MSRSTHSDLFKDTFDSPEGLADRIAEILGCPITIEDANHRIVSYSKHEDNVDDARIATIMRRKVPNHVINGLWKSGVMSKLFESDEPVIIPAIKEVGLGNRVAVSVRKYNEILGFIWAQTDNKQIDPEKLQLLKEAASLVKQQLLQLKVKNRKSDKSYQEFFWQLLTGHIQEQREIERLAKQYNMELDGDVTIGIIDFNTDITQSIEKHAYYLTETLQQAHVVCRVFDQNQLLLLIRVPESNASISVVKDLITDFIRKISERLQLQDITGSFGIIYQTPIYMQNSYRQALKVLELKAQFPQQLNDVYSYHALGIFQFLDELSLVQERDHYQNYSIEKLRTYDKRNNADLLKTMKVYLQCDSNVHQAAKAMHVHTNTLNYRLKRIAEVGSINLKDPNQKVTIYLDLLIENMKRDDL
ncbi:PucR family transcriptional regulator [Oceanobacillus halotolerans]|uniref:PucR family transcriptional regulator n=1 Tax=Oceanobacillus halotolerans TaxID=2663380 RepID=UPI001CF76E0F|nr:PucR family transcriptional regulator [Oceanobacillus halotolerans]